MDGTGKMLRHKAGQEECRLEFLGGSVWKEKVLEESESVCWHPETGRRGRKTMYSREGSESQEQVVPGQLELVATSSWEPWETRQRN